MDSHLITYPTWERYTIMTHAVSCLSVRERRHLFQLARNVPECSPDVFFPHYGISLAEFALGYALGDTARRRRKRP